MKSKNKLVLVLGILAFGLVLFITACKKETSSSSSNTNAKKLSVYLTDDPCRFDSVLIDIRYVEVKIDTSTAHMNDDHYGDTDDDHDDDHQHSDQFGKWDTLTIQPGVYSIMNLRNGVDTLLGTANLPAGKIRKIRLALGTNNSVVVNGVSHPLNLFNGSNNYVYVKLHSEDEDQINNSQSSVWLDFNVCESIKQVNGQYFLKPVLKPFGMNHFGKIEGRVLPDSAHAIVQAHSAIDSATAIPEKGGEYRIRGLREGIYSVTFKGSNGYRDTTITNIQVSKSKETHIPTITLHQ
jgi:hypothetical protein